MAGLNIISRRLSALTKLHHTKEEIFLDDVRKEFRPDLQRFIVGETLSLKEGKLVIGKNLYKNWLNKIKSEGFDYEIKFR